MAFGRTVSVSLVVGALLLPGLAQGSYPPSSVPAECSFASAPSPIGIVTPAGLAKALGFGHGQLINWLGVPGDTEGKPLAAGGLFDGRCEFMVYDGATLNLNPETSSSESQYEAAMRAGQQKQYKGQLLEVTINASAADPASAEVSQFVSGLQRYERQESRIARRAHALTVAAFGASHRTAFRGPLGDAGPLVAVEGVWWTSTRVVAAHLLETSHRDLARDLDDIAKAVVPAALEQ